MENIDLQELTKRFAVDVIELTATVPNTYLGKVLGNQLLRAGTSVGANTRAAFRGRSKKEFIAKLGIVIEEADECCYWLELLEKVLGNENLKLKQLQDEANRLTAIFTSISKKTKFEQSKRP